MKMKLSVVFGLPILIFLSCCPFASARLLVGSPEQVIANSTLILTGKVTESKDLEDERSFTVFVDRILKGTYPGEQISFSAQRTPRGLMGFPASPEAGSEVLLFLRKDDGTNYRFTYDLNCIAILEDQKATALCGGSNVSLNNNRWTVDDYRQAYNDFLGAGFARTQTQSASLGGKAGAAGSAAPESRPLFFPLGLLGTVLGIVLVFGLAGFVLYQQNKIRKDDEGDD
ncbi:MAG: hypothetical protein AB1523_11430 [Bacillota bacterium]